MPIKAFAEEGAMETALVFAQADRQKAFAQWLVYPETVANPQGVKHDAKHDAKEATPQRPGAQRPQACGKGGDVSTSWSFGGFAKPAMFLGRSPRTGSTRPRPISWARTLCRMSSMAWSTSSAISRHIQSGTGLHPGSQPTAALHMSERILFTSSTLKGHPFGHIGAKGVKPPI